jgi:hypothetical protein
MEHDLPATCLFVVACVISWTPGHDVSWHVWQKIAAHYKAPAGEPSKLAPAVGGFERVIYIFSAMSDKYELAAGWLVMKAFFGYVRSNEQDKSETDSVARGRYNSALIGNLLSLFIGVACGLGAKWILDHANP